MKKVKRKRKKYSARFKLCVIMDMRKNHLGYRETARKYGIGGHSRVQKWERIYLEKGESGLMKKSRAQSSKAEPLKKPLVSSVEEDLIAENQRLKKQNERLRMENEYLKKLDALIRAEEKRNGKKPK